MKRYSVTIFVLLLILVVACTSCVSISKTPSTTPIYNKKIESKMGTVSGSDSAWSVLGLWMLGVPDVDAAIKEAVKKKRADALVDVEWYQKTNWLLFFSITTVHVKGTAVKFTK